MHQGLISLILVLGAHQLVQIVLDHYRQCHQLKRAHENAAKLGKQVINISCGFTNYGHVNADIFPRNIERFVLYSPSLPLPFHDNQFGAAYSSHTLEHTENPGAFMMELQRIADAVFAVFPSRFDAIAYCPYHPFVALDRSGVRWMKNPFYIPAIERTVHEADIWIGSPVCRKYFAAYIQPEYFKLSETSS